MVNQNVLDTLIFFEITLRRITVMWDDAQVSERWAIDERKKGGGGYNTSSPISLSNIFYTKPDKKITVFIQYSLYFPCQVNWMKNTSRQIVVRTLAMYTRTVYRRILIKVFQTSRWICYFLNGSFYELANPLCLWISGTSCDLWVFFLCLLVRNVVCKLHMYCRFTSAGMRDTCIWTLMQSFKKVSKIVFYEIWSC